MQYLLCRDPGVPRVTKRVVMSMSTLVLLTAVCWWLSCAYNYALVSSNYNTNGLYPNGPITDIKDGELFYNFFL